MRQNVKKKQVQGALMFLHNTVSLGDLMQKQAAVSPLCHTEITGPTTHFLVTSLK